MIYNSDLVPNDRSEFGSIRAAVFAAWRGPASVELRQSSETLFYGWPILSLDTRLGWPVRLESRVIYANLVDDSQDEAVVRALSWDARGTYHPLPKAGNDQIFALPARFVRLPLETLQSWLRGLEGLPITVSRLRMSDSSEQVKRIRIEWDPVSAVFEMIWQGEAREIQGIDQRWNAIWDDLTEAILSSPLIENVTENYRLPRSDVSYDASLYSPIDYRTEHLV